MMTNTKTVRYFSKCTACKRPFVRDFQTVGGNCVPFLLSFQGWDSIFNAVVLCECGGRVSRNWKRLQAKFSAKHECNAKCESSTSHKCECSCRGKNHGGRMAA